MTADAKPSESDDRSILAGGHLLLMTSAGPFDVPGFIVNNQRYDDLIGASSEIQTSMGSLRLLNLKELIEQKKRLDRTKDRAAIDLLETVLQYRRQP